MGAGAILALAGIYYDSAALLNAAIGVLLVGFVLRFLPGDDERRD